LFVVYSILPSGVDVRARLIFATLIGLLLLSLATLETTELLRLADDTSNDVSLRDFQQKAASIAVPQSRDQYVETVQTLDGGERPNVRPQTAGSSRTLKDILQALCVMRT
jgi:hypothetical protein